jgi:hypothetical protein
MSVAKQHASVWQDGSQPRRTNRLRVPHLVDSQHMRVTEQHVLLSDLSGQAVLPQ